MRIVDIIAKKRDGRALSRPEIDWFIQELVHGRVADYQASALLMAIFLQGMNRQETVDLTLAMAASGEQLDLHDVAPFVVDKHSSGGVGDKTTLVIMPLVAACGVPVGKMSGRGLGSSGGTLDKLEAVPGWSHEVPLDQFKRQLAEIGLVLAGQTAVLAPADGILYALRDVTATVPSMPLIAASIMSKKLAAGTDAIVLDVKTGNGAFMRTVEQARELAQIMVDIGTDAGRKTVALLSDMNQPLGHAIGNALEVKEAIATLQGGGPADFWAHCLEIAGLMLLLAGKTADLDEAKGLIEAARADGRGWQKFCDMIVAQGGDGRVLAEPELLPKARYIEPVLAPRSGTVAAIDTEAIGWATVHLGGGRLQKSDPIDYAVGFVLPAKVGDTFAEGEPIAEVHANSAQRLAEAQQALAAAITWTDEAVRPLPHFYGTLS